MFQFPPLQPAVLHSNSITDKGACCYFCSQTFIPANSSATAVFHILNDNTGVGLMFETEGDTRVCLIKAY